ncbi:hypothetical protein [Dermacoccus nishinomiyaensis]|uniref:hypothetical protein n=1 Tax=Dermacoccus nishinomiyaensis TaxID=1274 RepID=UPI00093E2881|nr:hypothetical protein [Dermacoccus nishinomiyaensis]
MVTGQDVADFLGQGDDAELVALAGQSVTIITALARSYTRGNGFSGVAADEIDAVITTATARLVANPEQLRVTVGGVQTDGFQGWTLPELFVLNRYRRRTR